MKNFVVLDRQYVGLLNNFIPICDLNCEITNHASKISEAREIKINISFTQMAIKCPHDVSTNNSLQRAYFNFIASISKLN